MKAIMGEEIFSREAAKVKDVRGREINGSNKEGGQGYLGI